MRDDPPPGACISPAVPPHCESRPGMVKRAGALPPGRLVLVCPLAYLLIAHQRVYPIIWPRTCAIGDFLAFTEAGTEVRARFTRRPIQKTIPSPAGGVYPASMAAGEMRF